MLQFEELKLALDELKPDLSDLEEALDLKDVYKRQAPCTACGFCRQKEGCSIPDYQLFDTLYRNADVVVVATPV